MSTSTALLLGYLVGSTVLAGLAAVLSKLSLAVADRVSGGEARRSAAEAQSYQTLSMEALVAGDGAAYTACNRLANDAFGRSFFQQAAMAMGSLWPAFLAAAWMDSRFWAVRLPLGPIEFGPMAPLVVCYVAWRLVLGAAAGRRKMRNP